MLVVMMTCERRLGMDVASGAIHWILEVSSLGENSVARRMKALDQLLRGVIFLLFSK
jgi:hypothetical protein